MRVSPRSGKQEAKDARRHHASAPLIKVRDAKQRRGTHNSRSHSASDALEHREGKPPKQKFLAQAHRADQRDKRQELYKRLRHQFARHLIYEAFLFGWFAGHPRQSPQTPELHQRQERRQRHANRDRKCGSIQSHSQSRRVPSVNVAAPGRDRRGDPLERDRRAIHRDSRRGFHRWPRQQCANAYLASPWGYDSEHTENHQEIPGRNRNGHDG